MNIQSGGIVTSTTKTSSSGNHSLAVTVFPTTISWSLSENQTWTTISNSTGTGNATRYIYFNNNSSTNSRNEPSGVLQYVIKTLLSDENLGSLLNLILFFFNLL